MITTQLNSVNLWRPLFLMSLSIGVAGSVCSSLVMADGRIDFFETRIRPVLVTSCAECHSGKTPEGDFRVDGLSHLLQGGMSGPALVVKKPSKSLFIERLETGDADLMMPPEERLPARVIADFKKWVRDGAVWPDADVSWAVPSAAEEESHWAFQPLADVAPPAVRDQQWCQTEIDRFILKRIEEQGLQPVAAAEKRTLLRRISLDLTGLPPTPDEIDHFLADDSPRAIETVVDRLLESEAYGERWGRHWLDLARYADTSGDGTDMPIPEARYYRDYVISAFNRDMPYDQFLQEQLAGDLLAKQTPDDPRNNEKVIATGYIALSRRFGNSKFAEMELIIDDTIDTLGRSVLGLTLGCTRCHHHKFDPITMEDYYGLYGYFASIEYPHAGTEHQKERSGFVPLAVPDEVRDVFDSSEAWAVADVSDAAGDVPVFLAGDPSKKGDVAPRGFLEFLDPTHPQIPPGESGRLELARWVSSPANPLTPRVIVNRVWQYHFGKGLVTTSSNFGRQAPVPTHLHLLDWLAQDFISKGWSFKRLHKQILLSAVYQLDSIQDTGNAAIDEANTFYWRFDRQRMDAETLRDAILAVSGTLESGSGGRHPFPPTEKLRFTQGNPFTASYDHNRRSVYLMTARLKKHPFLALYDGPDPNMSTARRSTSTVALQALHMMNSSFVRDNAAAFADRLFAEAEPADRIEQAYELAFARRPSQSERAEIRTYLEELNAELAREGHPSRDAERLAWTSFARTVLASNEFVYVD